MQNFVPPCNVFSVLRDLAPEPALQAIVLEEGGDYCLIHRINEVGGTASAIFVKLELHDHSLDTVDSELSDMEDKEQILETDRVVVFTFVRRDGPNTLIGLSIPGQEELRIDVLFKSSSQ